MSLGVKLKSISEYYQQQITLVMDVLFSTYYILKNEYIKIRDLLSSKDYQKRYTEYIKIIDQLEKSADGTGIYLSEQHQDVLEKHREMRMNIPKSEHLMNMTLVYLMALFEGFNKKFFLTLLMNKPEQMKNRKKTINYEKLLEFDSLKDLHKSLAEKITNELGYRDIDNFNNFLLERYKIDLKREFKKWETLKDNYYRRNIIVHNNGRISELCIKKLNISPDLLNSKPIMNIDYLTEASNNIKTYMYFIFTAIKEKFKLNTSVRRFAPFPLNFDKPMVVKRGKDEIYKDD
ncbi:MAG TPA: hypothetical protein ENI29_04725 [bacterium]|nr:hypothetical protein [bacterium]